jgi:hypothetical protein
VNLSVRYFTFDRADFRGRIPNAVRGKRNVNIIRKRDAALTDAQRLVRGSADSLQVQRPSLLSSRELSASGVIMETR